ncbi:MAG: alpha/beta fold hydrolase [Nocardioides sp.]
MASEEMFADLTDDLTLCYQTFGKPAAEPLLLVMGLGGPMTWWDEALCAKLAALDFFVIRFDNRDTGRSTKLPDQVSRSVLLRGLLGRRVGAPYTLQDMARDAFGLLDHLGVIRAHVAGLSMGGMIAQTMAISAPDRIRSLTSIMSTTGKRSVGWPHPRLAPTLLAPRATGRKAYVTASAAWWRQIGSPGFPTEPAAVRVRAEETFDRGYSTSGVLRQMVAIVTQPDRTDQLRHLPMPALVVHGKADMMVHVSGGRATAAALPRAELMVIDGMGHDLPVTLYDTVARAIRRTADRAAQERD